MLDPQLSDFWSLSDLVDLSKAAFSALPAWLEGVSRHAASLARAAGAPVEAVGDANKSPHQPHV
jgi:hypothetical protein